MGDVKKQSLLTPCRQVGLSKKKSTPSSNSVAALLNSSNPSNISLNSPISRSPNDSSVNFGKNGNLKNSTPKNNIVNHCRRVGLSKTKINQLNKSVDLNSTPKNKSYVEIKLSPKNKLSDSVEVKNSPPIQITTQAEIHSDPSCKAKTKKSSKRLLDHYGCSETLSVISPHEKKFKSDNLSDIKNLGINDKDESFKNEFKLIENNKSEKCKQDINNDVKIISNLAYDIIKNVPKETIETSDKNKNCDSKNIKIKTKCDGNDDDDFLCTKLNKNIKDLSKHKKLKSKTKSDSEISKNKLKPVKKVLSLNDANKNNFENSKDPHKNTKNKISSLDDFDEDDFFTSTPEENIKMRLNNLQEEINRKKAKLDDLKRVKLYKKIHNIPELKKLTLLWKNGASLAVQDLLKNLNQHTEINMTSLLAKLNIPEDFL